MKQLVQSVGTGDLRVVDLPTPEPGPTQVLVETRRSLLSSGTERAVRELASASLLQKARARPDLVKQVIRKVIHDGAQSAMQSVRSRLEEDMPLGYSAAGVVVESGEHAPYLPPGTRVATASAGHAEMQLVPGLLAVPVPEEVTDEEAAFGAVAAIALQGIRQAGLTTGETVCVVGLGLVGQLTARLALASGLNVIGVDLHDDLCALVERAGGTGLREDSDTTDTLRALTQGLGVDAAIITAATASSAPVMAACDRVRDRGTIVVVGDVGLELDRRPFYEKELDLRFARSYGPGRYERTYEEYGIDYPIGHVRWTEGRNISAYLDLVARRRLEVSDLVSHVYSIDDAATAYAKIATDTSAIAVQFKYSGPSDPRTTQYQRPQRGAAASGVGDSALIGAGGFARSVFLPAMKEAGFPVPTHVLSSTGITARQVAQKYDIANVVGDPEGIFADPSLSTVFVLSRHDSHGDLVLRSLRAGKNVFVEKPLALTDIELEAVESALRETNAHLWVGFNRRYSEIGDSIRRFLSRGAGPIVANYRISAGRLPSDHWYKDRRQGGRLLGEVCHFVDFINWAIDEVPTTVHAAGGRPGTSDAALQEDLALLLQYPSGSIATISYAEHGFPGTRKERIEFLGRGHTTVVDDFQQLEVDGKRVKIRQPGKGHTAGLQTFRRVLEGHEDGQAHLLHSLTTTRTVLKAVAELTGSRT